MKTIERLVHYVTPGFDTVIESDFAIDDSSFQVINLKGIISGECPSDLETMGEGLLLLKERGLIFLCLKEPKYTSFALDRAGTCASWAVAGFVGVFAKEFISSLWGHKRLKKRLNKSLQNPNTFYIPFSDVVSVENYKIGGIFGKLKDVIVNIRTLDNLGNKGSFWLQAKNDDETWPEMIIQLKFYDEVINYKNEYIINEIGLRGFLEEIKAKEFPNADEISTDDQKEINIRIEEYIDENVDKIEISDDELRTNMLNDLSRYESLIDGNIYREIISSTVEG